MPTLRAMCIARVTCRQVMNIKVEHNTVTRRLQGWIKKLS
jgi:hypothetical protein